MSYPYVFFHLKDDCVSSESLNHLSQAEEIHFYCDKQSHIPLPFKDKLIYMYCFSEEDLHFCQKHHYIPHLSFLGDNIHDFHLLEKYHQEDVEFFWFPTQCHDEQLPHISNYLNQFNKAICISFHPAFNYNMINEQNRLWLSSLYHSFHNPLFFKELELIQDEFNIDNIYIQQNQYQTLIKHIVLGIHGDMTFTDYSSYFKQNLKLTQVEDCKSCEYQDYCLNKGIGYIMSQSNYQNCIGIQLFQPELYNKKLD